MAFTILAKDIGTPCTIIGQVDDKVQGKLVGKKQKQGQGDIQSVLFWSMDQANLLLGKDQKFQFVAFSSSWSTGKTLCMKEMANSRALESPQQCEIYLQEEDIARADPGSRFPRPAKCNSDEH